VTSDKLQVTSYKLQVTKLYTNPLPQPHLSLVTFHSSPFTRHASPITNHQPLSLPKETDIEYKRFMLSLVPPAIILFLFWLVRLFELADGIDLYYFGIFPRRIYGLVGIIVSPFIHANFNHLINNSVPFLFLLTAIFFFYQKVAWRVLIVSYLATGALVWIMARPSYHIGASGLVYSFASFLFFSGIVRRNINLLAISLLVIFIYGSMVWGIFPYLPDMSWESHLMGMTVGAVLSIYYRNEGPGPTRFASDLDDEEIEEIDEDISTK
jgi:membrane associated rhomboid family serine protease